MTKVKGRPRTQGSRYPGGKKRPERVEPTPQQAARRNYLSNGGDPAKTGYPLGILLVNGAIDERLHKAGCKYAWLYKRVFGKTSISAANYDATPRGRGRETPDDEMEALETELTQAANKLVDHKVKEPTDALCVFERVPKWMYPVPPTHNDVDDSRMVISGLNVLAKVLKE